MSGRKTRLALGNGAASQSVKTPGSVTGVPEGCAAPVAFWGKLASRLEP